VSARVRDQPRERVQPDQYDASNYCIFPKTERVRKALHKTCARYFGLGDVYAAALDDVDLGKVSAVQPPCVAHGTVETQKKSNEPVAEY